MRSSMLCLIVLIWCKYVFKRPVNSSLEENFIVESILCVSISELYGDVNCSVNWVEVGWAGAVGAAWIVPCWVISFLCSLNSHSKNI